jgi:SAM-dependent methyltransferase
MTACPLCGSDATRPFLTRRDVPVHQNLLMTDADAARATTRGDLELRSCPACGFVWNAAFRAELLAYGEDYENTQTASPAFDRYVDSLVETLVREGVRGRNVVEVGCGKGYFLERLCARGGNRGTGYDPSYVGPAETQDGRVRYVREFYGDAVRPSQPADVVVCRHVIEHVGDPVPFLGRIRSALDASPKAAVYFETPDLSWILEGTVIWDFFYEHCSYFTPRSLSNAFRRARFRPIEVRRTFEGQYLWARAEPAPDEEPVTPPEPDEERRLTAYVRDEESKLAAWRDTMDRLAGTERVAVWGAGAKGVTFVNLLDPAAAKVDCLVDVNPAKDGRYAPGTGHPILGPTRLSGRKVRDAILVNPNYLEETQGMVHSLGLNLRLHPAH